MNQIRKKFRAAQFIIEKCMLTYMTSYNIPLETPTQWSNFARKTNLYSRLNQEILLRINQHLLE